MLARARFGVSLASVLESFGARFDASLERVLTRFWCGLLLKFRLALERILVRVVARV